MGHSGARGRVTAARTGEKWGVEREVVPGSGLRDVRRDRGTECDLQVVLARDSGKSGYIDRRFGSASDHIWTKELVTPDLTYA